MRAPAVKRMQIPRNPTSAAVEKFGSSTDQPAHDSYFDKISQKLPAVLHFLAVVRKLRGKHRHEDEKREFRHLELDEAEGDPPPRAVNGMRCRRHHHIHQHHDDRRVGDGALLSPEVVIDVDEHHKASECERGAHYLAHQVEIGAAVLALRKRERRAVHHHDADADHDKHGGKQPEVDVATASSSPRLLLERCARLR